MFKIGDRVLKDFKIYTVEAINRFGVKINSIGRSWYNEDELTLYIEDLNLAELLLGHIGEKFYNPLLGYITLEHIECGLLYFSNSVTIPFNGKDSDGNLAIFPSKENRDWFSWDRMNKIPIPKVWNDISSNPVNYLYGSNYKIDQYRDYCVDITGCRNNGYTRRESSIEKAALALIKINILIEYGYGGNITKEEWSDNTIKKFKIGFNPILKVFICDELYYTKSPIAFHTKEQAEEFLENNLELVEDYYG